MSAGNVGAAVPAKYRNKAHQTAFANGQRARREGRVRCSPYGADNRSSAEFRRAWLDGYDSMPTVAEALAVCLDVMRRSDADSAEGEAAPCTDQEWDNAIAIGTAALAGGAP